MNVNHSAGESKQQRDFFDLSAKQPYLLILISMLNLATAAGYDLNKIIILSSKLLSFFRGVEYE
jgi:hypothetical protein